MRLPPGNGTRNDAEVPHLLSVASTERQPDVRLIRGHDRRPVGSEREHIELEDAAADLEKACDHPAERRTTLEVGAAADRGGYFTRVDDRARLQIFFDRAAREEQVHPRETRGDDENHQRTEDDELVADAEAHGGLGASPGGDESAPLAAAEGQAPRVLEAADDHARDGSTPRPAAATRPHAMSEARASRLSEHALW